GRQCRLQPGSTIVSEQSDVSTRQRVRVRHIVLSPDAEVSLHFLESRMRPLVLLSGAPLVGLVAESVALVLDPLLEPVARQPACGTIPEVALVASIRARTQGAQQPLRIPFQLARSQLLQQAIPLRLRAGHGTLERSALRPDLIRLTNFA